MSHGEIVAFLDDDVRLPMRWVAEMMAFYSDQELGGVGGFVDHPGHYNIARNTMYRLLGLTSNRYKIDWGGFNVGPANHPRDDKPAEWLSGGNMSFRRKAIEGVGGFDEALGSFWHEDVDVAHRVLKSGWKVISSRKVALEHYPSSINRPPLRDQVRERERSRVLFVWKAIGDKPLWKFRYGARLLLHTLAMTVVGAAKADPRIPLNVVRGGLQGLRELPQTKAMSSRHAESAS
jgi:GT2 family glycosyltransferase